MTGVLLIAELVPFNDIIAQMFRFAEGVVRGLLGSSAVWPCARPEAQFFHPGGEAAIESASTRLNLSISSTNLDCQVGKRSPMGKSTHHRTDFLNQNSSKILYN
jgi:hypothetical protein